MQVLQQWQWGTLLTVAFYVYVVLVAILIVSQDRDPTTTWTWLFLLAVFPVFGLFFYVFFGRDFRRSSLKKPWVIEFQGIANRVMGDVYAHYDEARARLKARYDGTVVDRIIASIEAENGAEPLPVRDLEIFPAGAEAFPRMIDDIKSAQKFVHMQFFIWEHDELTKDITDALLDRLKNGVEVRVTYDWFGSVLFSKAELKAVKAAGGKVAADVTRVGHLNYRNHRKMAIIDNEIGWTGGMNIGQEYIDGGKKFPAWRDTLIRFTGPATAELQKWFAARWFDLFRENILVEKYLPATDPSLAGDDPVMVQIVAQGVDDPWESSRRTHGIAISGAVRSVKMQSPYFIPDQGSYDALIGAALGGVNVQFMMTGLPDHKGAFNTAHTYWRKLIESGAHVYTYEAGFMHAKTLSIDSEAVAIGTMNMDIRSLKLHKELMAWIYDAEIAKQHEAIFENDLKECKEVTLADLDAMSAGKRFSNSANRLLSNMS